MKKILAVLLLLTTIVTAQTAEKKVWELLLANKRDDARKLFDKELKSKVASNINYFILDNFISLEQQQSTTGNDQTAEVTTTSGTQKVSQNQSLYLGKFNVPVDGEYSIFLDLGSMGNRHFVVVDGKPVYNSAKKFTMDLPFGAGLKYKFN